MVVNVAQLVYLLLVGIAFPVAIHMVITYYDRRAERKQARRSIGFMDELEARELQRHRKRQVMKQLRETARQAQQEQRR